MPDALKTAMSGAPENIPPTHSPLDMAAGVAAPLLAAISFTLVALTLQVPPQELRFADIALLLFVLAGLMFITAVQAGMWELRYRAGASPGASVRSKTEHALWESLTRYTYQLGVLALLAAIDVLLIPRGSFPSVRIAAVVIVGVGCLGEISWIISTYKRQGTAKARITGSAVEPRT